MTPAAARAYAASPAPPPALAASLPGCYHPAGRATASGITRRRERQGGTKKRRVRFCGPLFRRLALAAAFGPWPAAPARAADAAGYEPLVITATKVPATFSDLTRTVFVIGPDDIEGTSAHSVAELLEYVPGVDLRRRGVDGVQSDVSIRGATFEQTLVLVDGMKVADPQSGHHNLDVPVTLEEVDRIEVLRGQGSALYGPNAFGGVINIITKTGRVKSAAVKLAGGEYGFWEGYGSFSYPVATSGHRISLSRRVADGYRPNTDYGISDIAYGGSFELGGAAADVYAGYADKKFGANGFYSDRYPDQWEHTTTSLVTARVRAEGERLGFSWGLYWRGHGDDFILDKERPAWYRNQHTTDVYGAEMKGTFRSAAGVTVLGGEAGAEAIASTNLGDHRRRKGGVFLEHEIGGGDVVTLVPAAFAYDYTDWGWEVWPALSAGWRFAERTRLYGSLGKSFRVPTYTELYYDSPANVGNAALRPEEAWSYEVGLRRLGEAYLANLCAFRREGYNLIDWVRGDNTEPWRATNIAHVNTNGVEADVEVWPDTLLGGGPVSRVGASYAFMSADKRSEGFESKYVLDYIKRRATLSVKHKWFFRLQQSWEMAYEERVASEGHFLVDTKMSWRYEPVELFWEATNLFNVTYEDVASVPMPGRWVRAGVALSFG